MNLYLFNSYVKVMSVPAVKRLLTLHVARFKSFFVFREMFRFPGRIRRLGRFITLDSSTRNVFQSLGCQSHAPNPTLKTRNYSFMVTTSFRYDTALRLRIFALKPPLSRIVLLPGRQKNFSTRLSSLFNCDSCLKTVSPTRFNFWPTGLGTDYGVVEIHAIIWYKNVKY
jgi:hypothetical protein